MSDLSRLNPTPHAIAVYASQPLSPVATQHSLPSRSYPLLGPDLHRLDRTSLRLAHSLDHLVGAGEQHVWNGDSQRLRCREVDYQLELGWLLDRDIAGLRPAQNLVDQVGSASEQSREVRSVGHESPSLGKIASSEDRRQPCVQCKRNDARVVGDNQSILRDVKSVRLVSERLESRSNIFPSPDFEWHDFQPECANHGLELAHLQHGRGIANISYNCQPAEPRDNLAQEFNALAGRIDFLD